MFRSVGDALVAAAFVFVLVVLAVLCLPRQGCAAYYWPTNVPRWTRTPGFVTAGVHCEPSYAATLCFPEAWELGKDLTITGRELWFVAQEIRAIHDWPADCWIEAGERFRAPLYRLYKGPASRYQTVDMRTWHVCVLAGMRYRVRPALLVGIRLHEGGNRLASPSPWGCKPHGSYTLRQEGFLAAKIVRRHADRLGWDAWNPTRAQLRRLGGYYTRGYWGATNTHWGNCVDAIMRRAEGE